MLLLRANRAANSARSTCRRASITKLYSRKTLAAAAELIDEETTSDYRPSDHYPVKLGDVIHGTYTVKVKLGYGRHSTTWLCKDKTNAYKTLKIATAGDGGSREAGVFAQLHALSAGSQRPGKYCVRRSEETFTILSADGRRQHQCFAFEPLGPSLLEYVDGREKKALHITEVRWMTIYFLHALDFLHTHNVVHTDLKLDNIMLTLPDNEFDILDAFVKAEEAFPSRRKVADDGRFIYESRLMRQHELTFPIVCDLSSAVLGKLQHEGPASGLPYRAPEVILGAPWNSKIDIWSVGVVIWELILGVRLFGQKDEMDVLRSMTRLLGPPPEQMLRKCSRREDFFDEAGRWRHGAPMRERLEDRVEMEEEMPIFFDFMRSMLQWDADDRLSASELLKHTWLQID